MVDYFDGCALGVHPFLISVGGYSGFLGVFDWPTGLLLDDFALLPAAVELHREAADRGPPRQRHPELAFDHPLLGVLEDELSAPTPTVLS